MTDSQRGNRESQAVCPEFARIRVNSAADRGNAAEVNFTVPKLTKLFVVKFT